MTLKELVNSSTIDEVNNFWNNIKDVPEKAIEQNWKYSFRRDNKLIPVKWFVYEFAKSKNIEIDFNSSFDNRDLFAQKFDFDVHEDLVFDRQDLKRFQNFYETKISDKSLFQFFINHSYKVITEIGIEPYKVRVAITQPNEAMIIVGMRTVLSYKNERIGFIINTKDYPEVQELYNVEKEYDFKGGEAVSFVYTQTKFIPDITTNKLLELNLNSIKSEYLRIINQKISRWNSEANTTSQTLKKIMFEGHNIESFLNSNKSFEMEYFDLDGLKDYSQLTNENYTANSEATKIFNDTRTKLHYLAELLSKRLDIDLKNNYNERINKQGGKGTNFHRYKDYFLVGYIPQKFAKYGNEIFVKLSFLFRDGIPIFHYQLDINYKVGTNQFKADHNYLLASDPLWIPVDESFPKDWENLLNQTQDAFKKIIDSLESYLNSNYAFLENFSKWYIPKYGELSLNIYQMCFGFLTELEIRLKLIDKEKIDSNDIETLKKVKSEIPKYNYEGLNFLEEYIDEIIKKSTLVKMKFPLNQIMFGAPGVGKTFSTKKIAVEIIEGKIFDDSKEARDEINKLYEEYFQKQQIKFITFHQSLSYEDFIEGIKPIMSNKDEVSETIGYKIVSGIFKTSCAMSSYFCYKEQTKENSSNISYDFDELYNSFLEFNKTLDTPKVYRSISNKPIEIIDINKNDSIRARAQGSVASHVAPLTRENLQKLYDEFDNINEIKNLQQLKSTVGISPRLTEFYAIFQGLKEFEKEFFKPTEKDEDEKIENNLNEEEIIRKFEAGVFKNAVKKTAKQNTKVSPVVIIIDEINRGNVSSIFGELITLLEEDKRLGRREVIELTLPYSKSEFSIPHNLYIIGTMNTADRSVESLDTALRRRFSFIEMKSNPEILRTQHSSGGIIEGVIDLVKLLSIINQRIELLVDKDHQIGHSYFIGINSLLDLKYTFKNKIIPLLEEYFYGDFGKIGLVLGDSFITAEDSKRNKNILFKFKDYDDVDFLTDKKIYKMKEIGDLEPNHFISIYQNSIIEVNG